jgi:hypothetical protein
MVGIANASTAFASKSPRGPNYRDLDRAARERRHGRDRRLSRAVLDPIRESGPELVQHIPASLDNPAVGKPAAGMKALSHDPARKPSRAARTRSRIWIKAIRGARDAPAAVPDAALHPAIPRPACYTSRYREPFRRGAHDDGARPHLFWHPNLR